LKIFRFSIKTSLLKAIIPICFLTIYANIGLAQDIYKDYRQDRLNKAELYRPEILKTVKKPVQRVEIVQDGSSYQLVKANRVSDIETFYTIPIKTISGDIILDFGDHVVGRIQLVVKSNIPAHAPVQLKFVFGEVPSEMHESFSIYRFTDLDDPIRGNYTCKSERNI